MLGEKSWYLENKIFFSKTEEINIKIIAFWGKNGYQFHRFFFFFLQKKSQIKRALRKENPHSSCIGKLCTIEKEGGLKWKDWVIKELQRVNYIIATSTVSGLRVDNCVKKNYWKFIGTRLRESGDIIYQIHSRIFPTTRRMHFCLSWDSGIYVFTCYCPVKMKIMSIRNRLQIFFFLLLWWRLTGSNLLNACIYLFPQILFERALPFY